MFNRHQRFLQATATAKGSGFNWRRFFAVSAAMTAGTSATLMINSGDDSTKHLDKEQSMKFLRLKALQARFMAKQNAMTPAPSSTSMTALSQM